MKYIITESRLNDFITQYLNSWADSRYINNFDTFITITSRDDDEYIDEGVDMEYDYEDGRLFVNKRFKNHFMDLFNKTTDEANTYFKNWFEYKFGEKVEFVA
jgi:hypothetical protein